VKPFQGFGANGTKATQGSRCSNPGLKLANAFGVSNWAELANAFGVSNWLN